MKQDLKGLFAVLVLVNALAPGSGVFAQSRKVSAARSSKTQTSNRPKIRAAIAALEAAKSEMEHDDKDFGGHKRDALDAINNALKQLRLALQFEKY